MTQTRLPSGLLMLTADTGMTILYLDDPATASPTVYLGSGDSPTNYSQVSLADLADRLAALRRTEAEAADDTPIVDLY